MPIEIRELQIRINVNEQNQNNASSNTAPERDSTSSREKKDALVAECIEQTLRVIDEQQER